MLRRYLREEIFMILLIYFRHLLLVTLTRQESLTVFLYGFIV